MKSPHIPEPKIHPSAVVAPGAHVHGDVVIERDALVLFGAVIRAELDRIVIGAETNVQDNSVLHCDEGIPCLVGARVTIGHTAVVHGSEVADHALIGIGAIALNRTQVGQGAWLGAGSVLTEGKSIPPWTLAIGIPARPVRDLSEDEVRRASEGVDHYLEVAAGYRGILG
ncbi:MAG TPA: gamma carbonic anhydrase family protein [Acidimicrobiia bacterium]|nr:gamma carbonic anhydrase family protein [Acidimicrobiia bacterium]